MKNDKNIIDFIDNCNKIFFKDYFEKNSFIHKKDSLEIPKVSELHMHKILYYSYGFFYSKFEKELFLADFQAWKYGPVEKKYREYLKSNNENVKKKFDINLNSMEEKSFLEDLIFKLINFSPYRLVSESHNTKPWIDNYNSEQWKKIPNDEIKTFFSDKGKE